MTGTVRGSARVAVCDAGSAGLVEQRDGDRWSASARGEATGFWAIAGRAGRAIVVGGAPSGGAFTEEILP